jgi:hypothetical protein
MVFVWLVDINRESTFNGRDLPMPVVILSMVMTQIQRPCRHSALAFSP